ncbi:MAG: hypothetical protein AAF329_22805 [Cyanobacteria bacterium P01_A01_bin.17]
MLEKPIVIKLIKILVATAWLDGKIQPEEQKYLQKVAQEAGVTDDHELKPLLYGLRPVSKEECYEWVGDCIFGQSGQCRIPTPELQTRFLS